jgi:formate hydrogenlyase transcriptional activator
MSTRIPPGRAASLLEINNAIVTNLRKADLLHAICEAMRNVLPFDRAALSLGEPGGDGMRLFAIEGHEPGDQIDPGHHLPAAAAAAFRSPILRTDLRKETVTPIEHLAMRDGMRSMAIVPFEASGGVRGALALASLTPGRYSADDLQFLQLVANQVALAVANMLAYEEIEELRTRLAAENVALRHEIRQDQREIIGVSPALQDVLSQVKLVAPTNASVLITGETGTGKELVARAIHEGSKRREKPLVKINCAALPPSLVESELLGHERGAFTGAIARHVGRFELADGGTLVLDEVGELPLDAQAKLLRVLQDGEVHPIGSSAPVPVDVRVIASTNRDMSAAIRDRSFREDLYYRLAVFPIALPPLRERTGDIPLLAAAMIDSANHRIGRRVRRIAPAALRRMQEYAWPGNIRELQNVIERAVITASGEELDVHLPAPPSHTSPRAPAARPGTASLEDVQRDHLVSVLRETRGLIDGPRGAARILRINASTLRSRLKKLGIDPRDPS